MKLLMALVLLACVDSSQVREHERVLTLVERADALTVYFLRDSQYPHVVRRDDVMRGSARVATLNCSPRCNFRATDFFGALQALQPVRNTVCPSEGYRVRMFFRGHDSQDNPFQIDVAVDASYQCLEIDGHVYFSPRRIDEVMENLMRISQD